MPLDALPPQSPPGEVITVRLNPEARKRASRVLPGVIGFYLVLGSEDVDGEAVKWRRQWASSRELFEKIFSSLRLEEQRLRTIAHPTTNHQPPGKLKLTTTQNLKNHGQETYNGGVTHTHTLCK